MDKIYFDTLKQTFDPDSGYLVFRMPTISDVEGIRSLFSEKKGDVVIGSNYRVYEEQDNPSSILLVIETGAVDSAKVLDLAIDIIPKVQECFYFYSKQDVDQ